MGELNKGRRRITHSGAFSVSDVADIFGVEMNEIEQAVKDNPDKFPKEYIFEIQDNYKKEYIEKLNRDNEKFIPEFLVCFTNKGMYMLATILKSKNAKVVTFELVEAFEKIHNVAERTNLIFKIP